VQLVSVDDLAAIAEAPADEVLYAELAAAIKSDGLMMAMVAAMRPPTEGVCTLYLRRPRGLQAPFVAPCGVCLSYSCMDLDVLSCAGGGGAAYGARGGGISAPAGGTREATRGRRVSQIQHFIVRYLVLPPGSTPRQLRPAGAPQFAYADKRRVQLGGAAHGRGYPHLGTSQGFWPPADRTCAVFA
jgi:hypothetical protein